MKDKHGHEWSHKGLMYGFVPVYINNPYSEAPEISGRNRACDILFDIADAYFAFCAQFKHEPRFFFKVTGEFTGP